MADKTGTATLLDALENICLEYSAFLQMVKNNDNRWAVHLNDYRTANRDHFAQKFDAVRVEFQQNPNSPDGIRLLAEILESTILLKRGKTK